MNKPSLTVNAFAPCVTSRDRTRDNIACTIDDLVSSFLFYDRKEDKFLPLNAIEDAIREKVVTVEEIIDSFAYCLRIGLEEESNA